MSIQCLKPNCGKIQRTRGLCTACYNAFRLLVNAGKDTWAAAEARGEALPAVTRAEMNNTHNRMFYRRR